MNKKILFFLYLFLLRSTSPVFLAYERNNWFDRLKLFFIRVKEKFIKVDQKIKTKISYAKKFDRKLSFNIFFPLPFETTSRKIDNAISYQDCKSKLIV
jgi:hypothetical protein